MGGVPDQVEGSEPNNDDDEDGKMDKETAQRRFVELEPLRIDLVRFGIRPPLAIYPTRRVYRTFGRSPVDPRPHELLPKLHAEKDWSSHGKPTLICINTAPS